MEGAHRSILPLVKETGLSIIIYSLVGPMRIHRPCRWEQDTQAPWTSVSVNTMGQKQEVKNSKTRRQPTHSSPIYQSLPHVSCAFGRNFRSEEQNFRCHVQSVASVH